MMSGSISSMTQSIVSTTSWSRFHSAIDRTDWRSYAALSIVVATPLLLITALSAVYISNIGEITVTANELTQKISRLHKMEDIVSAIAVERGISCLYLHTQRGSANYHLLPRIKDFRTETNRQLMIFHESETIWTRSLAPCMQALYSLERHRSHIDHNSSVTCLENLEYYTQRIRCITAQTFRSLSSTFRGGLYSTLHAYALKLSAHHYQTLEATNWINVKDHPEAVALTKMTEFIKALSIRDELQQVAQWSSEEVERSAAMHEFESIYERQKLRDSLLRSAKTYTLGSGANEYCVKAIQATTDQGRLYAEASEDVGKLAEDEFIRLVVMLVGLTIAVLLCIIMSLSYAYGTYISMLEVRAVMDVVQQRNDEVLEAKQRTENLLYGMLPRYVTTHLKAEEQVPPRTFDQATISFMQVRHFSELIEHATPFQVVGILNSVYSTIDDILTKFDCYKVETVNDTYMVASGLPNENGDRHSAEICGMLLHVIKVMQTHVVEHVTHIPFSAGVNTGKCVATVIGTRQPRYCLFGDTVNLASRMNSTSEDYRVHLAPNTAQHIQQHHGDAFQLAMRGLVQVKVINMAY